MNDRKWGFVNYIRKFHTFLSNSQQKMSIGKRDFRGKVLNMQIFDISADQKHFNRFFVHTRFHAAKIHPARRVN
jgi:hypothetical protein